VHAYTRALFKTKRFLPAESRRAALSISTYALLAMCLALAANAHLLLCIEPRRNAGKPTLVSHRGLPTSPAFLRARRLTTRTVARVFRKSPSLRSRSTVERPGPTLLCDALQLRVGSRRRRVWVRPTQKHEPTRQSDTVVKSFRSLTVVRGVKGFAGVRTRTRIDRDSKLAN
jgi:hypothetical protein